MYQLKITKKTDSLALQHFNDVKERLLADIYHFLSGKHRIMRKVKIAIHGDKPSEDLLRHLSNEENLKELIVSHPDKLRDIISQLHPDAFDPEMLKTVDIRSPKTVISVHFSYSLPMAIQIY